MAEGIDDVSPLEHVLDGVRSGHGVAVFDHRGMLKCSRGYGTSEYGDGVVHEEFDADGGETGGWCAGAVRRRFVGEEEGRAVNGESGDNIGATADLPQYGCIEGGPNRTAAPRFRPLQPAWA